MTFKQKRYFKPLLLTLIFAFVFSALVSVSSVNAQGIVKISISNSTPKMGDKLKVDVEGTEAGDRIEVKFSSLLKFEGSTANHVVNGNVVTFEGGKSTLTFTCSQAGSADIIAKGSKNSASSVKVKINDGSVQNESDQSKSTEKPKAQYTIDGKEYIISERFADSEMPVGFKTKKLQLFNYNYKVATNDKVTLIYLKTTDNVAGKGTFFVYDEDKNEPVKFTMLGDEKAYVIVKSPATLPLDSNSMVETTLNAGDKSFVGYQIKGEETAYFYGVNEKAEEGWYKLLDNGNYEAVNSDYFESYKDSEKTPASTQEKVKSEDEGFFAKVLEFLRTLPDNPKHMLLVLIPVFVLLVILFVYTLLSKKDDNDDIFDDEDEVEDDRDTSRDENFVPTIESEFMSEKADETEEVEEAETTEDDEDDEEDEPKERRGFFSRHKKEKEDLDDWKKLSEMDLDDFTSTLKDSVREIQEEKENPKPEVKTEKVDSAKKKLDFIDLNDL